MARALLADFDAMPAREHNAARWIVLDEGAVAVPDDWPRVASEAVGTLRMDAARYPDDLRTAELVGELSMRSAHFRRWWADRKVVEWNHGMKRLHHPIVGELTLQTETLRFPGEPDQMLMIYMAKPGSAADEALMLLSSWSGSSR